MLSNSSPWIADIVNHRASLAPIPTSIPARLQKIPNLKAVIFDVYGTLVVSGSGDVGSADSSAPGHWISDAFAAIGYEPGDAPLPHAEHLHKIIQASNDQQRGPDSPSPEVNIVACWQQLLEESGHLELSRDIGQVVRVATAYEARANPTWPMPAAGELISELLAANFRLGIVSNAQIFTPKLVANLCGANSLAEAGFDLDLCFFSNRYRQSKPAARMFASLEHSLARRDITPSQAIYVGNDMLNDVFAASRVGLQTAWFAGDQRSCRPRKKDPRCASLMPDLTLTDLSELLDCLRGEWTDA